MHWKLAEQQYRIAERGAATADSAMRYRVFQQLGEVLMSRILRPGWRKVSGRRESPRTIVRTTPDPGKLGVLAFKARRLERRSSISKRRWARWAGMCRVRWLAIVLLLPKKPLCSSSYVFPRVFVHRTRRLPDEEERLTLRLLSNLAHGCWYCRSLLHVMWAHLAISIWPSGIYRRWN